MSDMSNGKLARKHAVRARFAKCSPRLTTTLTFTSASRSYVWLTQREAILPRR